MNYSLNQQTLILSIKYTADSMLGPVYTVGSKTDLVPISEAVDSSDCSGLSSAHQRLSVTSPCDSAVGTEHGRASARPAALTQGQDPDICALVPTHLG